MQAGLLTLVQWLSPAFPTGAFAYSHGLETAVADDRLTTPAQLEAWLTSLLQHGTGWQDAVLLAQGLDHETDLDHLETTSRALQSSAERLTETLDQGTAFANTLTQITGTIHPPRTLLVALAHAARPLNLSKAQVISLYLHAFASNLTSMAVRSVPLGQSQGQALLASLHPTIEAIAQRATTTTLQDLASSSFASDIAAMQHETLQPRLYRS